MESSSRDALWSAFDEEIYTMIKFLGLVMATFPLLGGVPTEAASAATIGHALLMNQTEGGAIVKVAEDCGIGNFRDEYGRCRHYGFGAPAAPPNEACPPDRHFVHWENHSGGRCMPNY